MILTCPIISTVFDTGIDKVNTIIIENQKMLSAFLNSILLQINGYDGNIVLSNNNKELSFEKSIELLTQFFPFDINKKSLITKVLSSLEKRAISSVYYGDTMKILSDLELYMQNISDDLNYDYSFSKLSISALLKSSGFEFNENYDYLGEKILDYFNLVYEYEREKLFITVNLRSYLDDDEIFRFVDTVLKKKINLIMIDAFEHNFITNEKRLIIDKDLCKI